MTIAIKDYVFIGVLAAWTLCSIMRFVHMYDRNSPFQFWRRWDIFHLVPVGAFFSPAPPPTEMWIFVRDFLLDGSATPWTEVPRIPPRGWRDLLWAPRKHAYRAKLDAARGLLAAAQPSSGQHRLPVSFTISESYLTLLRYSTALPRISRPVATQFAVIETNLLTRDIVRSVVSSVHAL